MTRLDRYIGANVAIGFLAALGGLLAIFSVINLAEELSDTTGLYTPALAVWFVLMNLPSQAYELFGAAALVGSASGLALMASHNELVAIFAAGVSPRGVISAVLKTAVGLAVVAALLGELLAAPLSEQAAATRSIALSGGQSLATPRGIWAREGARFVNIRRSIADGSVVEDLYLYDFDEQSRLERVTHAQRAEYRDQRWLLRGVAEDLLSESGVVRKNLPEAEWTTVLTPEQLYFLTLPPDQLSLADLRSSVSSMRQRGESAQHHLLAFWHRMLMPLVAAIMVFLAVPVILSMPQRVPFGYRVALAALLGIGFQMLNQTFGSFGLVYGLNPFLSASLPTGVALASGIWRLRSAF